VLLHGRAGGGKAALAARAAAQLGFHVVSLHLGLAAAGYGPAAGDGSWSEDDCEDEDEDNESGGDDDDCGRGGAPARAAAAASAAGRDAAAAAAIDAAFAEAAACAPCVLLLRGLEALGAAHGNGGPRPLSHPAAAVARGLAAHAAANAAAAAAASWNRHADGGSGARAWEPAVRTCLRRWRSAKPTPCPRSPHLCFEV
jgi:hypothetical protein